MTTALVVAVVLCLLAPPGRPAQAADPVRLGAAQSAYPGVTKIQAIRELEADAGRELSVVRSYARWTDTFPSRTDSWLEQTGHTLFLSIKTRRADGSYVPWAGIAAARPGDPLHADMVRWADALKTYAVPLYLAFNHEPETSVSHPSGTPAEYVAAWRSFVRVFQERRVSNVRFAWTTAVRNYSQEPTSSKYAPRYYPGDDWVDVLAIDAYNMYCLRRDGTYSRPWRSLEQLLAPFMDFAAQHPREELVVAEFGTPEDPADPRRKARWIDEAAALFQRPAYSRFRAVLYWNQLSHNFQGCDFRLTSSAAALDAFRRLGADPYYSAR